MSPYPTSRTEVAKSKRTVLLTGASGSMGSATLCELLQRRDRFDIVLLAYGTKHGRRALRPFLNEPGVRIVWGDLRDYASVLECVSGADVVLHTAALISPAADRDPVLTEQINVGSIRNILRAIAAQPDPDRVGLVSVGSVATTGSRLPPLHWGRVGDPITPAVGDHYAVSKIEAERLVVESGHGELGRGPHPQDRANQERHGVPARREEHDRGESHGAEGKEGETVHLRHGRRRHVLFRHHRRRRQGLVRRLRWPWRSRGCRPDG